VTASARERRAVSPRPCSHQSRGSGPSRPRSPVSQEGFEPTTKGLRVRLRGCTRMHCAAFVPESRHWPAPSGVLMHARCYIGCYIDGPGANITYEPSGYDLRVIYWLGNNLGNTRKVGAQGHERGVPTEGVDNGRVPYLPEAPCSVPDDPPRASPQRSRRRVPVGRRSRYVPVCRCVLGLRARTFNRPQRTITPREPSSSSARRGRLAPAHL